MPLLLRVGRLHLSDRRDLASILLPIRRATIILVVLLGYAYVRLIGESYALVTIGLVSFAAAMQFVPAIVGGIYWKGATKAGALAGLTGGFLLWIYTLLLPSFARSGWITRELRREWSAGHCLPQAVRAVWTRGAGPDLACHDLDDAGERRALHRGFADDFAVHYRAQPGGAIRRHLQADSRSRTRSGAAARRSATCRQLLGPLHRRGARECRFRALRARRASGALHDRGPADSDIVSYSERQLAGAIGAASARIMVASVLREEMHDIDQVMQILDEASQLVVYSRQLEQKSRELEAATTELRAANERLKELDKLKDDFVATVSHEVRTPLTSIRSFSEILRDNPDLDQEQRQEFVSIIVQESERLTRLINDILDLAKMEAGTSEWHMADFAPRAVIEQALAATAGLFAKARHISLETRIAADLLPIRADADRLTQVIVNLISNAVKFCAQKDGRIELRSLAGCGLPPRRRQGQRHRHRQGRPAEDLRTLPAGRQYPHGQASGHRAWSADFQADFAALRRRHLGRERARARGRRSPSVFRSLDQLRRATVAFEREVALD